ncbi:hypothetical protein SAMN05518865_102325 [Duganella sp. CF458]|uniref:hypothetical protein n=1 Tax=Duganella sp. CF458 TaxID=1884368 RepID=UPI0008E60C38|nr:hypothetical protein [Duganella sp. CF458]SFF63254.1 hypothetical protein SAMN05518865_102325 [Duganella sp. CF458]
MQAQADFRPARRAWLVLIALGHVALLMAWRPMLRNAAEPVVRPGGELVFLTLPAVARPRPAEPLPDPPKVARPPRAAEPATLAVRPAPPPVATDIAHPEAPAASTASTAQSITLQAPVAGDPADPFAKPAPAPDTLLDKARSSVAGIDRQLRKESLNKFTTYILPDTKLGMAIAKAQKKEWVLEQTVQNSDGVTMKRYRRGNQEYCEYTNLVGARGQDPFRDNNKTKVMTCP